MRSSRAVPFRALSVLGVALLTVVVVAGVSPGATKFLTKKKALKLFYTKGKMDETLKGFYTKAQVDQALTEYYTKTEADGRYVGALPIRTGYWSCPSQAFQEFSSSSTYVTGEDGYAYGDSLLTCNVTLPHGATVTGFSATLHDTSPTTLAFCDLSSKDLSSTIGEQTFLAFAETEVSATPGDIRVAGTFHEVPLTIDNQNFAYRARCMGDSGTSTTGFFGVTITYTLTAIQGAAA